MQIDLTKMPLGKLSRKQIESAYKILGEAQTLIKSKDDSFDSSSQSLLNTKWKINTPIITRGPVFTVYFD